MRAIRKENGMKIALVAEGYPPMSGGVATSARRVSQELAALGHDVTVLDRKSVV